MLSSPKTKQLCLPSFGKWCTKSLESSLSWEWHQSGKCSNSILTPDWQEPRGRARKYTGYHLWCNHQWQPSKLQEWQLTLIVTLSWHGQHLTPALTELWSAKQHYLSIWPFLSSGRLIFSWFSFLFTDLIFFSFLKYLFNFLSICLSSGLQKWISSPSSLPF